MPAERLVRIPQHIGAGAIAALVTAAVHLSVVTFSREVLGNFSWSWSSRDVIWMILLGYLTVYGLVSVPVGLLAALLPNGVSARATAWLWGTLVSFASLLHLRRFNSAALLILALAIGYQFSRFAANRPEVARRLVTRGGIALAGILALLITASEGRRAIALRRELAAQPRADSSALNILLIIWDTARAKNFSLYGYGRETTPFLDSLARRAVVFDRAFSTAPWTLPSHASMLTGQYGTAQSGDWLSPMDASHRTLPEELRDRGYATGGFVSNWLAAAHSTGLARGFTRYEDTQRSFAEVILNTTLTQSNLVQVLYTRVMERYWMGAIKALLSFNWRPQSAYQAHAWKTGAEVSDAFLNWQSGISRPFFAMLNYSEAHDPHLTPDRDRFNGGAKLMDRYDAALLDLDREVQRIFSQLESRGVLGRTIVVVTSDHGEQFGEHGLNGHGNSLYMPLVHVPLVVYAPRHPAAGRRITRAVSLRDIPRTLLDLAGISDSPLPGAALLPRDSAALANVSPSPAIFEVSAGINDQPKNPTNYGDMIGVADDSLQVIRDGKGAYHVFEYQKDTAEVADLAVDPQVAAWARARIDALIREFGLRAPNVRVRAAPAP